MKKSVRIILIVGICVVIILIPVLLYNKLNQDYQKNHENKNEKTQEELKIKDDITLEVNSPVLDINDLFSEPINESYEIKYFVNAE